MNPRQLARAIYETAGDKALRAKPDAERRLWVGVRAKLEGLDDDGVRETVSHVEALLRDNARPAEAAGSPAAGTLSGSWSGRMDGELPAAAGAKSRMFDPRGKVT